MKKINYTIPTKKEEITLNQFIKYEEVILDETTSLEFKQNRIIEIFTTVPFDHVNKLHQTEIDTIFSHLNPILSHQPELHKTFIFKGLKYGLIPNFSKDLLAGEFIDLDVYAEQKKWLEVMSILYRPITFERRGQYLIESYTGSHTNFKDLPFHYFTGVLSFFLSLFDTLATLTQKYTEVQLQQLVTSHSRVNSKVDITAMST